jgi:hypothetical protein
MRRYLDASTIIVWLLCLIALLAVISAAQADPITVQLSCDKTAAQSGDVLTYSAIVKNTLTVGDVIPNFATLGPYIFGGVTYPAIPSEVVNVSVDNSIGHLMLDCPVPARTSFVFNSVKKDGQPLAMGLPGSVPLDTLAPQGQVTVQYQVKVD